MRKLLATIVFGVGISTGVAAYAEYDTQIYVPFDHVEPVYETQNQITGTQTVCNDVIVRGNDNRIIGTIIGGVIGNEIDKGAGAVIGGILGHEIGKQNSSNDRIVKQCTNQPVYENVQRFRYYNVYYRINGNTHMTRMHIKPEGPLTVHLYPNLRVQGGF